MRQANSRAPRGVSSRRLVMYARQNSGNATNDSTSSCGRHPATSAMHSDPARYHFSGPAEARPFIQKYRPHTENARPSAMGSE